MSGRFDMADRSFTALAGTSLLAGMFVLCGAVGCVLVALLALGATQEGAGALVSDGHWLALVFVAVVGAGVVLGLWSVGGQLHASRRLARRVSNIELPPSADLRDAAKTAGLQGRVKLVDSGECFSFAYGALSPRVVVSLGLAKSASPSELNAVLEHERYHVRNLDPLKVLLARAAPRAFFYIPALSHLHARYIAGRELAADRRALAAYGQRPLASALIKVVRGPRWGELQTAAAIGGPELLDVRIAQLETGAEPRIAPLTRRLTVASILAAFALTGLFVASVAAFGGPAAIAYATGEPLTLLNVAGVVLCGAPWVVGGWLGYRWLGRRTERPLDTTHD